MLLLIRPLLWGAIRRLELPLEERVEMREGDPTAPADFDRVDLAALDQLVHESASDPQLFGSLLDGEDKAGAGAGLGHEALNVR